MKAWNWKRSSSQHAPSLYDPENSATSTDEPYLAPAPFRTYSGALCFHNGISPSKMVPRNSQTTPPKLRPRFPKGDQGLHPIDLKKAAAKGPRSQGKIRSLLRDLNLLVGGWNLNPLLVQICASQSGVHLPKKFWGAFFLPPPGFFFTPEN